MSLFSGLKEVTPGSERRRGNGGRRTPNPRQVTRRPKHSGTLSQTPLPDTWTVARPQLSEFRVPVQEIKTVVLPFTTHLRQSFWKGSARSCQAVSSQGCPCQLHFRIASRLPWVFNGGWVWRGLVGQKLGFCIGSQYDFEICECDGPCHFTSHNPNK